MSYPRKLHILVVEDDSDVIEAYRVSFTTLKKAFQMINPVFVRSFSDAKKRIDGSEIFHVVLLDMNLPMETRGQPVEGLAPGEQLLEMLAKRDNHPVPVLLVVSGKLNLAQPISNMQKRLENDFWYGRLVNKGLEQHHEIESGLTQALRYLDVGIHIGDSGNEWFPTLSPREVDLLRRCVLTQGSCLGIDLRWWNAENGPSISRPPPYAGSTKVLMGRFVLDEGLWPLNSDILQTRTSRKMGPLSIVTGILGAKAGPHKGLSHRSISAEEPDCNAERDQSWTASVAQRVFSARPKGSRSYCRQINPSGY